MTTAKQFLTWLEISFWNVTIPILNESSLMGRLMCKAIWVKEKYDHMPQSHKAILWIANGWISGLLGGLIVTTLLP